MTPLEQLKTLRWPNGRPRCPRCQCDAVYTFRTRKIWKCKACGRHFTLTSGTVFAGSKMNEVQIFNLLEAFRETENVAAVARAAGITHKAAWVNVQKLWDRDWRDGVSRNWKGYWQREPRSVEEPMAEVRAAA